MASDVTPTRAGPALFAALLVGCATTSAPAPSEHPRGGGGVNITLDASLVNDGHGAVGPWTLYGIALAGAASKTGHVDYLGELMARGLLATAWKEESASGKSAPHNDAYLDAMVAVADAGFMPEYVLSFLAQPGWV